ncbi:Bifunctional glutamate/proline--tRNA ligase [Dirofilaria immitis]|nr:Bifunctional glutamate/proline--tRNA ligase [Dirofilaria immitis]
MVEEIDAREMKIGDSVTLINWGNIKICDILKVGDKITGIKAKLDLENKDYKKTLKVTWIADTKLGPQIPVKIVEYSHIISKAVIGKEEDWKQFVNYDSMKFLDFIGESAMKDIRKGDIVQLQRKGYYICDSPYVSKSEYSGFKVPIILILIPDGSNKPAKLTQTTTKEDSSTVELRKTNDNIQINGNVSTSQMDILKLNQQIKEQGDLVRSLKIADPKGMKTKEAINELSGDNYRPEKPISSSNAEDLYHSIEEQGNLVRSLKAANPKSDEAKAAISKLLDLKKQYKERTGLEYKPKTAASLQEQEKLAGSAEIQRNNTSRLRNKLIINDSCESIKMTEMEYKPKSVLITQNDDKLIEDNPKCKETLARRITEQGDLVRSLKAKDAKSPETKDAIAELLRLKKRYKDEFDEEYVANANASALKVIIKADMIEYYDVSGCYILRPWSFAIWENALQKEKEHIADFAPEVAWVTRAGNSELSEPIAIRPTSETVIYPSYAKWVQSYRDLPIRLNQWCNVVRWEFKHPTPFLRTREFLWQEGHTAFQTKQEAEKEVFTILDLYAKVYTDFLAIPVTKGRKSEKEKFAGGEFTTTVEVYVPVNGRGIQGATSHHLGQNFSKMFDISFEDPETGKKHLRGKIVGA